MASALAIVEPEHADGLDQSLRLLFEAFGGRCGFFDQRRILLRHFVHLRNRQRHLENPGRLLAAGLTDLFDQFSNALEAADDIGDRRTGFMNQTGAALSRGYQKTR